VAGESLQGGTRVSEEFSVSRTKIRQAGLSVGGGAETILGAAAVTEFEYVASAAKVGEGIEFGLTELLHCRLVHDIAERSLSEVAKPVGVVHELIAGEDIAVMLERQDSATGRTEYAKGVGQAQERPERFLEELHRKRAKVAGDPIVERTAQKFAEDFWIRGAGADTVERGRIVLDEGQELQRFDPELAEEAHEDSGIPGVLVVQDAKHVERDPCPSDPDQRLDDQALGGQISRVSSIGIVVFGWAVQAKPDGEFLPRQEIDPLWIEPESVGL